MRIWRLRVEEGPEDGRFYITGYEFDGVYLSDIDTFGDSEGYADPAAAHRKLDDISGKSSRLLFRCSPATIDDYLAESAAVFAQAETDMLAEGLAHKALEGAV